MEGDLCDIHGIYMGVSMAMGVPKNGWFTMENPIKMDDLFQKAHKGLTILQSASKTTYHPSDSYTLHSVS